MNLRNNRSANRRRGVILLVVLAMLTLFAIAGITFVLYANACSESARISRDAETINGAGGGAPDMDPMQSANTFLAQLIYGVADDTTGVESSLRGHSLAETMYGSWDSQGMIPSDVPFSGTGRLHEPIPQLGMDGYSMVNYMLFTNDGNTPAANSVLRDPSCLGTRNSLLTGGNPTPRGTYTGGQNPPYTYPDLNSMFLASINASTGQVVTPSYYRGWLFDPNNQGPANPNWTNPQGKYLTLRPRPADMGAGFPMPDNNGLDVKNLTSAPGGNDSMWMDIGAPVLSTASGFRYKMLVAPLILDLDNRVNLNVAGNVLFNGGHAGNQGWGPWEVNMSKVLSADPTEWQNLFNGYQTNTGRYGSGHLPIAPSGFNITGPSPHPYAKVDLNGVTDPPYSMMNPLAQTRYQLPGGVGTQPFQSFPFFPTGFGNGGYLETTITGGPPVAPNAWNHPLVYNPLTPAPGNSLLSVPSHADLMWKGVASTPGSDLVKLAGIRNFSTSNPNLAKLINETTDLSMDLDRPGAAPSPAVSYGLTAGTYPTATPVPFPGVDPLTRGTNPGGEFIPSTWRSALAAELPRLNLNRKLTDFVMGANNQLDMVTPANQQQNNQAMQDRQQFAKDIFQRLVFVTTGNDIPNPMPGGPQGDAMRWLAQLAVNIVDYIDTDDIMTPFNWDPNQSTSASGWVFGTEAPKLVVNEAYYQYNNGFSGGSPDPGSGMPNYTATLDFRMDVWVELLNPMPADPNPNANAPFSNTAQLQYSGATNSAYQVVLAKENPNMRQASNTIGDPGTNIYTSWDGSQTVVKDSDFSTATQQAVLPVDQAYSGVAGQNQGFYLLGPSLPTGAPDPFNGTPAPTLKSSHMSYTISRTTDPNPENPDPAVVLVRRLANPYLPVNTTPGPGYNPYVTTDYVDLKPLPPIPSSSPPKNPAANDARKYTTVSTNNVPPTAPSSAAFASYGRTQPYAADWHQWQKQAPSGVATGPLTTFFQHNAVQVAPTQPTPGNPPTQTLKLPFDWLVHLDRAVISPMELLQVSGFKPHELTQQFVQPDANPTTVPFGDSFKHVAPWTDENARLYRFFEFVKTGAMTPGIADGGRIPGKVNINTLDASALEVFRALVDAEPGNAFSDPDAVNVFNALVAARTPGGVPGPNDVPFWGMGIGPDSGSAQYPAGVGIKNTLLAAVTGGSTTSPRLLTPNSLANTNPPTHPYQQMELLNKLFNNVTTRSNTFAVWLTVGFFPVVNDQVQPVQLGPEIGLAQNHNKRHHIFAIVDRTQIVTFGNLNTASTTAVHYSGPNIPAPTAPATSTPALIGIPNPVTTAAQRNWQIQAGSILVYGPGQFNEETVVVYNGPGGLTANFTQAHGNGANVISRGHPGPMNVLNPPYSAAGDTAVIPYLVIID